MRSLFRFSTCLLLAVLVGLTSCRRGDRATDAEAATAAEAPRDPWALPQDSLYGATAVENLRPVQVDLELRGIPRGWDGIRIAVLSDFLLGMWPDNVAVAEAAVSRAVATDPDLVVLLGDYLAVGEDVATLDRVLAPLRDRRVLAVLGDRDLSSEELAARITDRLSAAGVRVLRNEVVAFVRGNDTAYIAGIEPAYEAFVPAQQQQLFANLPVGAPTPLLLSHLPTVLPRLPEGRFRAVLAAHAFCGDVEVPGSPRLATLLDETLAPQRVRRSNRLFQHLGNTMFVSCGLGYSFVPARFAAPPEVAFVTLRRIPEPRGTGADTIPAVPAPAQQPQPAEAPEPEPQ
jgi:uncharacterized protein